MSVSISANDSVVIIAKLANAAGLIVAIIAMLTGALELRSIDSSSNAMRVAVWHMMTMATVWNCFLLVLMLSISTALDHATAQIAAAVCAAVGFLLMVVGGWFGGRLVYEFGIAVKGRTRS